MDKSKALFERLRQKSPLGVDFGETRVQPKLTNSQLQAAISNIGFDPPDLLIRLYQEFGNGGFGMGYGMMGLGGGFTDDMGSTCDDFYSKFAIIDPEDRTWEWPEKLLPFCHFGCAIYTCLDCNHPNSRVVYWDPNIWEAGTPPKLGFLDTGMGFLDWMHAWIVGEDLWNCVFGEDALPTPYFSRP